jgi:hypothetical protein
MKKSLIGRISSFYLLIFLFISSVAFLHAQEAVKSSLYDNGKMWTFDYPPTDYFTKTYNFTPSTEWFTKARLSAVRLPAGCSASFISEDGLVMTNHHCARGALDKVNRPGEDLPDTGYFARSLDEERKVPGMQADVLQVIEDVTKRMQTAFESGKTDEEKLKAREAERVKIEQEYSDKDSILTFNVVSFYNGGRYSVYGYKRYNDVRLVFAVETQTGFYGGDYDNFTYPRYDVDLSLFRVYENDKPLKTPYYYKWSKGGVKESDVVFIVGNPGRTSRLLTVSQLEFNRDYAYAFTLDFLNTAVKDLTDKIAKHPEKKLELQTRLFSFANSQKAYGGQLDGLRDKYMMDRKRDFEKNFKEAVMKNPELKAKYATVWDEIEKYQKEKSSYFIDLNAFGYKGRNTNPYYTLAADLVNYAAQMKKPESEREKEYTGPGLDLAKEKMALGKFDSEFDMTNFIFQLSNLKKAESKYPEVKAFFNGKSPEEAAKMIVGSSVLNDRDKVKKMVDNPDEILKSTDPLLSVVAKTLPIGKSSTISYRAILPKEAAKVQLLGNAIYDVYGTQIPPDATFTPRIADGVVKGYEYNGTIAPPITTFYGMYDRYYSHQKPDWDLPPKWKNPPANFKMATPVNFVASADIIGGNSGSPVINKNLEVVGLVFDGNIESLPGEFIFLEEKNRTVAVHSEGILEALGSIYKADRLVAEIKSGKIVEVKPALHEIKEEKPVEKTIDKKKDIKKKSK